MVAQQRDGMVCKESEEGWNLSRVLTAELLLDRRVMGVGRGIPKERLEEEEGGSRRVDSFTFLDTDCPFVCRDLLSHDHEELHKGVWVAQDKPDFTFRGSKYILGDNR